jgi:perosamine synthetase
MIPLFAVHMPHAIDKPLLETLHSGYIGQGSRVDEFEKKLGEFIGFQNIATTCSGTAALQLALRILRIGSVNGGSADDQILTTPMTCSATNMPILAAGAAPVWVDVHSETGLIDELDVERKINQNTRAIMCVHWGGNPCNLATLRSIADHYDLYLIEDAAHAFGAIDPATGRKIGNQSADITMFSFQAIKHISTVDGGALSIKDTDIYRRARLERWYGIDRDSDRKDSRIEEDIIDWGVKLHMNDVNATSGIHQLDYIDGVLAEHRQNARQYYDSMDMERFQPAFWPPALDSSAFWLFTILLRDSNDRASFVEHARKWQVQVSQVHARNDTHTVFRPFHRGQLPGVAEFNNRMCCIPVHWKLSLTDRDRIVSMLESYKTVTVEA